MAYLNGSGLSGVSGDLTSLLQVVFTKGIMLQINEEFADWENVSKLKVDNKNPRSIAYMLQKFGFYSCTACGFWSYYSTESTRSEFGRMRSCSKENVFNDRS
jgi:hypothetical protein